MRLELQEKQKWAPVTKMDILQLATPMTPACDIDLALGIELSSWVIEAACDHDTWFLKPCISLSYTGHTT